MSPPYCMHPQSQMCTHTERSQPCASAHTEADGSQRGDLGNKQAIHLEKWESALSLVERWTWQSCRLPVRVIDFLREKTKIWQLNFLVHKCVTYAHPHPEMSIYGTEPNMLHNENTSILSFLFKSFFIDISCTQKKPISELKAATGFSMMPGSSPTAPQFALESYTICTVLGSDQSRSPEVGNAPKAFNLMLYYHPTFWQFGALLQLHQQWQKQHHVDTLTDTNSAYLWACCNKWEA